MGLLKSQVTLWLGGWAQEPAACHFSLPLPSLFFLSKPSWYTQLPGWALALGSNVSQDWDVSKKLKP